MTTKQGISGARAGQNVWSARSKRFAFLWLSGDATLSHITGISRHGEEYFAFGAQRLVRPFKLYDGDPVINDECELLGITMFVLIWSLRQGEKMILIICKEI